jgi:hypothetical protein
VYYWYGVIILNTAQDYEPKQKTEKQLRSIWKQTRTLVGARYFPEKYIIPDWFADEFLNEQSFRQKFTLEVQPYVDRSLQYIWRQLIVKQSLAKQTYLKNSSHFDIRSLLENLKLTQEEKNEILMLKKILGEN